MPAPRKKYYQIGEVSRLLGLETHVLRYWEKEFPQIRPRRVAGRRLYQHKDLELIRQIKALLYEEGLTIAGAKKKLKAHEKRLGVPCIINKKGLDKNIQTGYAQAKQKALIELVRQIRQELIAIKDGLQDG